MIKEFAALFPGIAKMHIVPTAPAAVKLAPASKPHAAVRSAGHPGKHVGALVAHTTKASPAPKAVKVPMATTDTTDTTTLCE